MSARQKPSPRRPIRKDQARIDRQRRAADVRRRQITAPPGPSAARPSNQRAVAIASAVAVAVVAVIVAIVIARGGDAAVSADPSLAAPLAADQDGDWAISEVPSAFRIVYRHDQYSASGATTTTEEHTVRRPFESVVVTKADAPPGGDVQQTVINNFGTFSQLLTNTTPAETGAPTTTTSETTAADATTSSAVTTTTVAAAPEPSIVAGLPRAAYGDVRLDASLADLIAEGRFEQRERRTLLGRDCQVYRTGQSIESGAATKPTARDYADACVDASGMLLEEVSIEGGKVVAHLTATEVDTSLQPTDDLFAIVGGPAPIDQGGTVVTTVPADDVPSPTYWVLGTAPAGFEHRGRYQVQQGEVDSSGGAVTNPDGTQSIVTGYADVYVSGTKTIVVRQGPTSVEQASAASAGESSRIGGLGIGQAAATPAGASLVAHPGNPGDWFVQIDATATVDEVLTLARAMHTVAGPPAPAEADGSPTASTTTATTGNP